MRIAITATTVWSENSYRNAGISRFGFNLVDRLLRAHPEDVFTVFTHTEFEPPNAWLAQENVTIVKACEPVRGSKAIWETFGTGRLSRKGQFDVWLSTHHATPWNSGVPDLAMIHDMIPLVSPEFGEGLQTAYLKFALKNVAKRATHLLTNSETSKEDIVKFARVDPAKITVIPLGPGSRVAAVGPEDAPCKLLEQIPFQRFLFGLGTLEPRKNLPNLFRALSILHRKPEFQDVGLVLAGGRGWKEEGIFDELRRLGIEENVVFLGYVPDEWLPFLFALSRAFVFPSLLEGFGMPILEAMIAGAPVIASGVGAMREVGGDAPAYFDPHNPEDICETIVGVLTGRFGSRLQMAARGLERSRTFTWESAAQMTYDVLAGLALS